MCLQRSVRISIKKWVLYKCQCCEIPIYWSDSNIKFFIEPDSTDSDLCLECYADLDNFQTNSKINVGFQHTIKTSINDWTNDTFHTGAAIYDFNTSEELEVRYEYLEKYALEWVSIKIYEYYDGIQITVSDGGPKGGKENEEKKILINTDGMVGLTKKIMEIVHKMSNLIEFTYLTRFASEWCVDDSESFKIPIPSVKTMTLQNISFVYPEFIGNVVTLNIHECDGSAAHIFKSINLKSLKFINIIYLYTPDEEGGDPATKFIEDIGFGSKVIIVIENEE